MPSAGQQGVLSVPLHVSEVNGDLVGEVGAAGEGVPKWGSILLLQVAKKRIVAIGRGENAGHTFTYTNVVRSIDRIGMWNGTAMRFEVPAAEMSRRGSDGYVVILQSGKSDRPGAILAAAKSAASVDCRRPDAGAYSPASTMSSRWIISARPAKPSTASMSRELRPLICTASAMS